MEIKMPDGAVLVTDNKEVIESYITQMGGVEIPEKKVIKKSATKDASTKVAE